MIRRTRPGASDPILYLSRYADDPTWGAAMSRNALGKQRNVADYLSDSATAAAMLECIRSAEVLLVRGVP